MKVVVDLNLSPEWVAYLNDQGWEAGHWSQLGDPTAPDREILQWARARTAIVFTNDLDFGRLLALTGASGPSVFQVRGEDLLPESIGSDVVAVLREYGDVLDRGGLIVLDESSLRVRILPLNR